MLSFGAKRVDFTEVKEKIWECENQHAEADARRLVIMGGVHGDEPAGVAALEYVKTLKQDLPKHIRSLTLIVGNPKALEKGVRGIDADLNRLWNDEEDHDTTSLEYKRHLEIRSVLFRPSTVLFDIHTTSAEHHPFVILDHTPDQETYDAIHALPATFVTWNWSEFIGKKTISGGLHTYGNNCVSLTCEMGQHDSPQSVENAIQAVSAFLDFYFSGEKPSQKKPQRWLKVLQQFSLREMNWEWEKEEVGPYEIKAGEVIGYVDGIKYYAPVNGFLLMPNKKFSQTNPDVCFFAVEQSIH